MSLVDGYLWWLVSVGIPYCYCCKLIRAGDTDGLWNIWPYWFSFFCAQNKTGYARLTIMVLYFKEWLQPEIWKIYWSNTVLRTPNENYAIPMGLLLEHVRLSINQSFTIFFNIVEKSH